MINKINIAININISIYYMYKYIYIYICNSSRFAYLHQPVDGNT